MGTKVDFSELERILPPVVFRTYPRWKELIPYSPRSLANYDSLGTGPAERIRVGRVVGYPRAAFLEWLRQRSTVLS